MATAESLKSLFNQQTPLTDSSIPVKSFEEIYKTSYSHGLEAIYAIENIDLRSIRPISQPFCPPLDLPQKKLKHIPIVKQEQLEFDFGDSFRNWIESFLLREPIQVLGLSRQAEKGLLSNEKKYIRDLVESDIRSFIFFKGMGQGHIDEIKQKLSHFLNGRLHHQTQVVDITSWIRSLLTNVDRKKAHVCLQLHQLESLVPLSLSETIEVNRLPIEKRHEWANDAIKTLQQETIYQSVHADMKKIIDVFIKPWVRSRLGLANRLELCERLERISDDSSITIPVLNFLTHVFFEDQFPLNQFLIRVEGDLYCADESLARSYLLTIETVQSYFYKSQICYTLSQLVRLVAQEMARGWQGFDDGFLEKAIRQSPRFYVRKQSGGELAVCLA